MLGPLSGNQAIFGLNQLRGVVDGAIHATVEDFGRQPEEWQTLFTVVAVDTAFGDDGAASDKLAAAFNQAEASADAVFGPVSSQEAVNLLVERNLTVKVPTIITTAATTRIRSNPEYGKLLIQVSPSIDTYANQYMRYVGHFLEPRPKHVLFIGRDDEYGRSSAVALTKYASADQIDLKSALYRPSHATNDLRVQSDASEVIDSNRQVLTQMKQQPTDWMVMVGDTGAMLKLLCQQLKSNIPGVRIGTLSSPDFEQVSSGAFNGMYVIYSFAPVQFSLNTLSFYQYARIAEPYVEDLLPLNDRPTEWPKLETVDAEVHDATVFWISQYMSKQVKMPADFSKNLYVTNFSIRGDGPKAGNEGALYLFKVEDKKVVPVEVNIY